MIEMAREYGQWLAIWPALILAPKKEVLRQWAEQLRRAVPDKLVWCNFEEGAAKRYRGFYIFWRGHPRSVFCGRFASVAPE